MSELNKNGKRKAGAVDCSDNCWFCVILECIARRSPSLGISARYMLLIDFFTLAALAWAMISLYKIVQISPGKKGIVL